MLVLNGWFEKESVVLLTVLHASVYRNIKMVFFRRNGARVFVVVRAIGVVSLVKVNYNGFVLANVQVNKASAPIGAGAIARILEG